MNDKRKRNKIQDYKEKKDDFANQYDWINIENTNSASFGQPETPLKSKFITFWG